MHVINCTSLWSAYMMIFLKWDISFRILSHFLKKMLFGEPSSSKQRSHLRQFKMAHCCKDASIFAGVQIVWKFTPIFILLKSVSSFHQNCMQSFIWRCTCCFSGSFFFHLCTLWCTIVSRHEVIFSSLVKWLILDFCKPFSRHHKSAYQPRWPRWSVICTREKLQERKCYKI